MPLISYQTGSLTARLTHFLFLFFCSFLLIKLTSLLCNCLFIWTLSQSCIFKNIPGTLITIFYFYFLFTADLSQPGSSVIVIPAPTRHSPPTPPKRMTPVTKRHSVEPSPSSQVPESSTTEPPSSPVLVPPAVYKSESSEGKTNAAVPQTSTELAPSLPSHIPPSPPRVKPLQPPSLMFSGPTPTVQTPPPSPTTEPPSQPPPIPLHIRIQKALASPKPVQPNPDSSHRAHSLLFESSSFMEQLSEGNSRYSLPVTIEPLRL